MATGAPIKQSDAPIIQSHENGPTACWQRERKASATEESLRDGGRKGGSVSGSADARRAFASLLCAAIVHQSLLEAKSVRTEQRFLRDLGRSAGMSRRKAEPGTRSDGRPETLVHDATAPIP